MKKKKDIISVLCLRRASRRALRGPGGGSPWTPYIASRKKIVCRSKGVEIVMHGFFALLFLCCAACSSLPKKIEPHVMVEAEIRMNRARDAQNRGHHENALAFYLDAYEFYTRLDHIPGKINAGLSVSRQYFYLDHQDEAQKWLKRTSELIDSEMPEMKVWRLVLEIETAFAGEDYRQVIAIASDALPVESHLEVETEILCYVTAAKSRLKKDYSPEFTRLQTLLPKLQKRFRKRKMDDPEVLSLGYYYSGYIFSSAETDWRKALEFFEKAKEIDGLIGNTRGVGKDLYALGRCYEGLGDLKRASGCFLRSLEIFRLLDDGTMIKKLESKIGGIKK